MNVSGAPELDRIRWATTELAVEIPSWGFVNTGTRFRVFPQAGVPRNAHEKIEDAATVARYTGSRRRSRCTSRGTPSTTTARLAAYAAERGIRIGGINSNTFQDEDYKLGSITHPSAAVRRKAVDAIVGCCEIARATGSDIVKVWLSDGTNYPGQDDFRARRRRLIDSLQEVYAALPENARMVLEYKLYEPAFYHTDVQDWGQSLSVCQHLGERAQVCVDTGHHAMAREHRADRGDPAAGRPARRVRPERQEVRRRRPDGRQHRPVPALPDLPRARRGDAGRRRLRRARHARTGSSTCSTSATTSSRRSRR